MLAVAIHQGIFYWSIPTFAPHALLWYDSCHYYGITFWIESIMEDLLNKISTYHIFNYLLPGTLFAGFGQLISNFTLVHDDVLIAVFLYYFYGMVISRLGSILLEPALKIIRFIKFAEYKEYVTASDKDPLVAELSETNNMYRTLCSLFLCLIVLYILDMYSQLDKVSSIYLFVGLFVLFLFAYRKQTVYLVNRIRRNQESS